MRKRDNIHSISKNLQETPVEDHVDEKIGVRFAAIKISAKKSLAKLSCVESA
jgi:hypothetical protein